MVGRSFRDSGRPWLSYGSIDEPRSRKSSKNIDDLMPPSRNANTKCIIWRELWSVNVNDRSSRDSGRPELSYGSIDEPRSQRCSEKIDDLMSPSRNANTTCTIWQEAWSVNVVDRSSRASGRLELSYGSVVEPSARRSSENIVDLMFPSRNANTQCTTVRCMRC